MGPQLREFSEFASEFASGFSKCSESLKSLKRADGFVKSASKFASEFVKCLDSSESVSEFVKSASGFVKSASGFDRSADQFVKKMLSGGGNASDPVSQSESVHESESDWNLNQGDRQK